MQISCEQVQSRDQKFFSDKGNIISGVLNHLLQGLILKRAFQCLQAIGATSPICHTLPYEYVHDLRHAGQL
jgi:hypothetical protein